MSGQDERGGAEEGGGSDDCCQRLNQINIFVLFSFCCGYFFLFGFCFFFPRFRRVCGQNGGVALAGVIKLQAAT